MQRRSFLQAAGIGAALTTQAGRLFAIDEAASAAAEFSSRAVASGIAALDDLTGGFHPSELTLIAGRPATGKTDLAQRIAQQVAINGSRPVIYFSHELLRDALLERMKASNANVRLYRTGADPLSVVERERLRSAGRQLAQAPLHIDDTAALSPKEILERARRFKTDKGDLGLVIVDYLQLVQSAVPVQCRADALSAIAADLKRLATDLDAPLILLAMLHRDLLYRANKRPLLADLNRSGAIEPHADQVLLINRDERYHPDPAPDPGVIEIQVAKNRRGPTGTVRLPVLRA